MISSKQIRALLREKYPKLRNIWLRNKTFRSLTVDELEEFVGDNTPIIDIIGECDDFSAILHGRAKAERIKKRNWDAWVFGECLVRKYRGRKLSHSLNLAITGDRKIWLIEPQTGEMWVADPDGDGIYFVWI